jgi:hypothetical protein
MNDAKAVRQIESLMTDIDYAAREIKELIPHITDPVLVEKLQSITASIEEASECCEEAIEEFNETFNGSGDFLVDEEQDIDSIDFGSMEYLDNGDGDY